MDHTLDNTLESANRVYSKDGICPTIPTCAGGNIQPKIIDDIYGNREARVYKEIAPTLRSQNNELKTIVAMRGRNPENSAQTEQRLEPKEERFFNQALETLAENDCEPGDTINAYNKTVDKSGVCPTLTTRPEGFKTAILPCVNKYRIRKLTPKECWRLMGFTDEDFEKAAKVNSNTQLYKQAGNSIVKDVLMAIFRQMID